MVLNINNGINKKYTFNSDSEITSKHRSPYIYVLVFCIIYYIALVIFGFSPMILLLVIPVSIICVYVGFFSWNNVVKEITINNKGNILYINSDKYNTENIKLFFIKTRDFIPSGILDTYSYIKIYLQVTSTKGYAIRLNEEEFEKFKKLCGFECLPYSKLSRI